MMCAPRSQSEACCPQQLETWRQCRSAPSAGQETEVPDTHKALRKHVQQETAQEFIVRQAGKLLFVGVSRLAPAKSGDRTIGLGSWRSENRSVGGQSKYLEYYLQ